MPDMPKVNPRNMVEKTMSLVSTHATIREGIHQRATEHQAALEERDRELNAKAKLQGKTP